MANYTKDLGMTLVLEFITLRLIPNLFEGTSTIPHQCLSNFNTCNSAVLLWYVNGIDSYGVCWVDFNYMVNDLVRAAVRHESVMMVFVIKLQPAWSWGSGFRTWGDFFIPKLMIVGLWPRSVALNALLSKPFHLLFIERGKLYEEYFFICNSARRWHQSFYSVVHLNSLCLFAGGMRGRLGAVHASAVRCFCFFLRSNCSRYVQVLKRLRFRLQKQKS